MGVCRRAEGGGRQDQGECRTTWTHKIEKERWGGEMDREKETIEQKQGNEAVRMTKEVERNIYRALN